MRKSLKQETVFYGIAKYANVIATLLTSSVLARILKPAEFGVVSVATVFTAFFTILSDMGLGTAVIQNKTLSEEETNDIFSFSVYMSVGLGLIFALLGTPISLFYGDSVYMTVCAVLSISVFFNAANIIPNAVLMKGKNFRSVGRRLILAALISGSLAIVLALSGCGYYAIVAQSVCQSVFIFLWNFCKTGLRFRLKFNIGSIKKVQQYSAYQFSYSIINYFARNLDNLLIGKVLGSVSLAYYDKGYRLMMYPVQNLTYVINPIVHPILSEYQNDKAFIYSAYLKLTKVLSLLGVLISALCFWCSEEIILIFFGKQWYESISVFRLLSLSVWPQLVSASAGSIYQSLGNTKLMFRSGLIHFGLTIALIVVGVFSGDLQTVALLVTISLYLRFFIDYFVLIAHAFRYPYKDFLREFLPDVLTAAVLAAAIVLLRSLSISGIFPSLLVKAAVLGTVYIITLAAMGQLSVVWSFFKGKGKS